MIVEKRKAYLVNAKNLNKIHTGLICWQGEILSPRIAIELVRIRMVRKKLAIVAFYNPRPLFTINDSGFDNASRVNFFTYIILNYR